MASDTDLAIREFPEHPRLGRKLAVLDPSSRQYAAVGVLTSTDEPLHNKTWRRSFRALDQGYTSECVAYSAKGMMNTVPLRAQIPVDDRLHIDETPIYKMAQTLDPWPGESYDGTSCLAGAKALKNMELIRAYRWCFGLDDVVKTLSGYGPVTIGVSWYNSMFDTDEKHFIDVRESSGLAGGHAVQLIGVNVDREYVIIANSWGESWGDRGRAFLSFSDLDTLLEDWGEAYTYMMKY